MTDLSESKSLRYKAKHKIRFVTAASLFDGHDASINIMRRILQASGAEVIHLGHNRSVDEVVSAALQEDVQGIAISSYQGGHIEYFKYMVDLLQAARAAAHIQVFGGGGGVIVPAEIKELQDYGVARIYTPEDGQKMGLQGMINDMLARCDFNPVEHAPAELKPGDFRALARVISAFELGVCSSSLKKADSRESGKAKGARSRRHRHRRLGQEFADRRAGAPLPPRPGRPAEDRDPRGRSLAPQDRRRAAGRPHPHERDPRRAHLHALAGDARLRRRDRRLPAGGDRRLPRLRVRPGDRRDLGHRPGRRGRS